MPDQYLSTDPNAGDYLSTDPQGGTPVQQPSRPDDSMLGAIGRGMAGFWEQVNPATIVQGIATAVTSPVDTAKGMFRAQGDLYTKAAQAFEQGDYITGARHGINYLLPILGPALDAQGDKAAQGDIAGAIGGTFGIAANVMAPEAATGTVKTVATAPRALSSRLARGAEERIADVITPKVGANKVRFGNKAADIAPALAREPGLLAFSREGLAAKVAEKFEEATAALDNANAARNPNQVFYTDVIARALEQRLDRLKVNGVIPAPNQARAAQLQQAIKEVRRMGPTASYDALRRLRQAYDEPARAVYNPSLTADFTLKMGEKRGAADVTGVLRERLAKADPTTAEANARYSLFKAAQDVLDAAEETDRVRPKVGRRIMTRFGGAVGGGVAAGPIGAAAGYLVGPVLDSLASMAPTTRIATARAMQRMADALDAGDASRAYLAMKDLARLTGQTARLNEFMRSGVISQPGQNQQLGSVPMPVPAQ